ncbi:ABC transporter [Nonomuraea jabiensis]|uniref:ABC-2 type transport system permease protein n=1 Tax=Nonomuraea jabiensis TaxID=882448 RepID=A0A7W9LGJ5_9ACTN|nr:ABC transporter [Nonomuraea jabiensis]MBB5782967.1 ABC-2 type transport system permease protein [Nonomuraea jabiensis]
MSAIRLADLLRAELTKTRTLPATWIALGVASAANTVLALLAATDAVRLAGQDGPVAIGQLGTLMVAPVYVFAAIAVFAAGSEYRAGQLRVSLAAVPDRHRLAAAKLAAVTAACLLAAGPAILPGHLVQPVADPASLLAVYLLLGLVGYGFAVVASGVVAPLAVLFVTPVLISPALRGSLPDVVRFLPHEAALSLLGLPADPATALSRTGGLLTLVAWAGLSAGAGWAALVRRDA